MKNYQLAVVLLCQFQGRISSIFVGFINKHFRQLSSMTEDSSIYLFFRPMWKSVIHFLTGQTEIERVARSGDVLGLDKSIFLSKMLVDYKKNHSLWAEAYHSDLCEELCAIKNIRGSDSKFRVGVVLETLHSWKHAIVEVQKMRKTVYDSSNEKHQEMLMAVWERLRPGRKIKARKSNEWIELGFQAEDPATDFRGAGLLGLINLHGWVDTVEGRQTFKVADNQGTDYFFASASMFMTMMAFQLLKEMYIPPEFWILRREETVLSLFQHLFESVWLQFALFWNLVRDKSMMQFNQNLLQFSRQVKESRIHGIIQDLNLKKVEKMA